MIKMQIKYKEKDINICPICYRYNITSIIGENDILCDKHRNNIIEKNIKNHFLKYEKNLDDFLNINSIIENIAEINFHENCGKKIIKIIILMKNKEQVNFLLNHDDFKVFFDTFSKYEFINKYPHIKINLNNIYDKEINLFIYERMNIAKIFILELHSCLCTSFFDIKLNTRDNFLHFNITNNAIYENILENFNYLKKFFTLLKYSDLEILEYIRNCLIVKQYNDFQIYERLLEYFENSGMLDSDIKILKSNFIKLNENYKKCNENLNLLEIQIGEKIIE